VIGQLFLNDCVTASQFADTFYAELNTVINIFFPLKIFRSAKTNKKLSYPLHIFKLYRAKTATWWRYKRFKTLELHEEYKRLSSRFCKAVYMQNSKKELLTVIILVDFELCQL